MAYSHSRLSTFENCPLQYKFKYIDRLTATLGDTIEAFMGSRVHDTLEKLYTDLLKSRMLSMDELLDYYQKNWEEKWEDDIRVIKKDYTADDYRRTGEKCLKDYYRRYHPFDQGRTIGIEERIRVDLGEGRKLTGFIDRLVRNERENYEIHDYKTSSRLPTQDQADRDRQLALYQIGVGEMWDDVKEVELVWHYLVFDREIRSVRSPGDLEKLKDETNRLIDRIEAAETFEPSPGVLCGWCEFKNVCPVWKHQFAIEELPTEKFKEDEGVKLVDEYAAAVKEKRELKEKIEELKESLIEYCRQFGYETVFGTDRKVTVGKKETFRFPSSGGERREQLEEILHKEGSLGEFFHAELE